MQEKIAPPRHRRACKLGRAERFFLAIRKRGPYSEVKFFF